MERLGTWRYAIAIALLAIVGGLYVGMHPLSQRLLTPPPGGYVGMTILIVMVMAGFAAYALCVDIPSRLARRLAVLAVMMFTLYAGGETARGLYARQAFGGELTRSDERWMVVGGGGQSISATSMERHRTKSVAATPEAIAAVARFGQCVTLPIERSPAGAERIGQHPPLTAADLSGC